MSLKKLRLKVLLVIWTIGKKVDVISLSYESFKSFSNTQGRNYIQKEVIDLKKI